MSDFAKLGWLPVELDFLGVSSIEAKLRRLLFAVNMLVNLSFRGRQGWLPLCAIKLLCDLCKLFKLPSGYGMLGVCPVRAKLCMLSLALDMPGKVSAWDRL